MTEIFIIKENKFVMNWKEIFQVPEFSRLQSVPQNPMWHFENWVSIHTMYVTNYAMEIFGNDSSVYLNKIMALSALFHDIGKCECTIFNPSKQSWSSPLHAEKGAELTRQILRDWGFPSTVIEQVCFFVKNHMKPLDLYGTTNIAEELKQIAMERNDGICTIENLIKLKTCDCLGSIMAKEDGWREKLNYIKDTAIRECCYN